MTSKQRTGRYTIRFERLIQEVGYVDVEAESFAQALEAVEDGDIEDLEFEWDDYASPKRAYSVNAPDGTTLGFKDIGRKPGFRLDYEDLRDFIPDVARVEFENAMKGE